jgi:putative ABC transport system substrate-binding protein
MRAVVPSLRRAAVLPNPDNPGKRLDVEELARAARQTGVSLEPLEVRAPWDVTAAFAAIERTRPDALITLVDTVTWVRRQEIADFALRQRVPTGFNLGGHVEVGGLLSCAPPVAQTYRRAGVLAGKVLRGARPADLPVERPTHFELAINLKTTRALGLTVPPSLLLRADQVIE